MIKTVMLHISKIINHTFLAVLLTKLFVLMINLAKNWFFAEKKIAVYKFVEAILKEYDYCKNMIKKRFNGNLVMSAEDEKRFKLSNKCGICNKLFVAGDNKVRDHDRIAVKYRGSAH